MALLSWEYYSSLHNAVSEEEFERAEAIAEKEVARAIGPYWSSVKEKNLDDEIYGEQLQDCICSLIDYNKEVGESVGKYVASVSNDGYTESYAHEAQTPTAAAEDKNKLIRTWLSGSGLVGAY